MTGTMTEVQPTMRTLAYVLDGDAYVTYSVAEGWPLTEEPAPVVSGYAFSGWTWPSPGKPAVMPASNLTVTGSLTEVPQPSLPDDERTKTHTVTYIYGSVAAAVQTYAYHARITPADPPPSPASGGTWSGWIGLPSLMPAHDIRVTGEWAENI